MKWVLALLALVAVGACAAESQSTATAGGGKPVPVANAYTRADVVRAGTFLATHPRSPGVGGHEFDGVVVAMTRSHDKPNSLRITVLRRDATVWIVDPRYDRLADSVAALIGVGDWVIVHTHHIEGATTAMETAHDLRLVEKAEEAA